MSRFTVFEQAGRVRVADRTHSAGQVTLATCKEGITKEQAKEALRGLETPAGSPNAVAERKEAVRQALAEAGLLYDPPPAPRRQGISVTIPAPVLDQVNERSEESIGGRSGVISRDLDRLYALYRRELRQAALTVDEALAICDAMNGVFHDVSTAHFILLTVEDALEEGLEEKWGIVAEVLLGKLRGCQSLAVLDACERFWLDTSEDARERAGRVFGIEED